MESGILIKMTKTAVVYDKWLSTLGGGEVVACGIAKVLLDNGYQVTFISGEEVALQKIKERLDIDLRGATFETLWNDQAKLNQITSDKDVFVNTSYSDFLIGKAKKNYYYAFFPGKPNGIIDQILVPLFELLCKPMEFLILPATTDHERGEYLLKAQTKIAFYLLKKMRKYHLQFYIHWKNFNKTNLRSIKTNIEGVKIIDHTYKVDHQKNTIFYDWYLRANNETIYVDIVNAASSEIQLKKPVLLRCKLLQYFAKNKLMEKIYARARAGFFPFIIRKINQYDRVFTCAQYPADWIKRYWNKESVVLYPPIEMLFQKYDLSKYKKRNWIVSVGRFFTSGHGKKQEIMVEAFKKFYDQGHHDWELHLAGGLNNEPTSQDFMKKLKQAAQDYPIFFHCNCSRQEIEDLYLQAKIYWHAAGYGENKEKDPIKFEHFGIAPIEAMSAGCVPVLYNGGGLPETLKVAGLNDEHLFNSIEELANRTMSLLEKDVKIEATTLKKLQETFSADHFEKTVKKELDL